MCLPLTILFTIKLYAHIDIMYIYLTEINIKCQIKLVGFFKSQKSKIFTLTDWWTRFAS